MNGIDNNLTAAPCDIATGDDGTEITFPNDGTRTTQYAMGVMGSTTPSNLPQNFTGATGRHTDGSNFLATDGYVKWLRGPQVSRGHTATAGQYQAQTAGQAASTSNMYTQANSVGPVALTFSPV